MQTRKLSELKVKSSYLRTDTDIEKLKKSIETVGIIQPLVINENNELISGGRRYSALKELGIEEAPVHIIEQPELQQELMSIDENLVRLNLNKVEFEKCLSRGREIYEELNPVAKKYEEEDLTIKEENEIQKDAPNKERSFVDMTAEKTGLSKKVIKSAIDRDLRSSGLVKEYRKRGELNASQTNELIKLNKDEQEKVLDQVIGKSAREIKDLVSLVKDKGVDEAIIEVQTAPKTPKEYKSLSTLIKRSNKLLAKILLEEFELAEDEKDAFFKDAQRLQNHLTEVMALNTRDNLSYDADNSEEESEDYAQNNDLSSQSIDNNEDYQQL
jgi:ParB family chromosome partitioning protein